MGCTYNHCYKSIEDIIIKENSTKENLICSDIISSSKQWFFLLIDTTINEVKEKSKTSTIINYKKNV